MINKPKSLLILYTGNVGSSPLIKSLTSHPCFFNSWIFEDLDQRNFKTETNQRKLEIIEKVLNAAINPNKNNDLKNYLDNKSVAKIYKFLSRYKNEEWTAFKWRPWGGEVTQKIIINNNVTVVIPYRKDILDHCLRTIFARKFSKKYFNEEVSHLQFLFLKTKMSDEEFLSYDKLLKSFTFTVNEDDLKFLTSQMNELFGYHKYILGYSMQLSCPIIPIDASLITGNLSQTVKQLGQEIGIKNVNKFESQNMEMRKAGLYDMSQCKNYSEIAKEKDISSLRSKYSELIKINELCSLLN